MRYAILSTTEHDKGLYSCTVTNTFGSDTKYLNLYVHLDFGGNGSGSGKGGINVRVYYCSNGVFPEATRMLVGKLELNPTTTNLGMA